MTKRQEPARAVGADGKVLKMDSATVKAHMDAIMADPDTQMILVVARRGDDIICPVMGPPSDETLALLETVVQSYREALKSIRTLDVN